MLWRFFHIRLAEMNGFLTLANCLLPLYVLKVTDVVNHRRTTALKGLPLFLREDPNKLFKTCKVVNTSKGLQFLDFIILVH